VVELSGRFGRIQLAAMGVTLGSQGDLKQPDLASAVSQILTAAGGFPSLSENPSGRTITYSARHDGLVLTIARLLRPLWSSNVTVMAMGGRQILNIPSARLQTVQTVLQKLRTFLEQYVTSLRPPMRFKLMSRNPFPRHVAQGDAKLAWDQEELSLEALQSLLKNVIEAISFLDLLDKYKLPEIVAK
jgi:nuclear pore complex protein Nup155